MHVVQVLYVSAHPAILVDVGVVVRTQGPAAPRHPTCHSHTCPS